MTALLERPAPILGQLRATGAAPRLPLSPIDAFVLSRIDGALTAAEIAAITPMPEDAVRVSLERLLAAGAIETRRPPASGAALQALAMAERIKGKNHYEVLGVPASASREEITAAYFKITRRFHPDSFPDRDDADVLNAVRAIFKRVSRAFEVLGQRESRALYDAGLPARPSVG